MVEEVLEIEMRGAAAWVWMNRPAVHNALNEDLIRALTDAFRTLGENASVRAIMLTGRGKSFSAGADVESMKRQGAASPVENLASARELAEMFHSIAACPKPAVARVNGAAIGGGLGLVSACDIAIASNAALFAASEVRLGLIPATIGPYVVQAIGARWARRLFLTGERIAAAQAEKIGLVHESVDPEKLDERVQSAIDYLLAGAPGPQKAAKDLIDAVTNRSMTPELMEETAVTIAHIRATDEAREGLSAFLEKRPASWVPQR
jgi:methylglutaconyl-CoA hydratase